MWKYKTNEEECDLKLNPYESFMRRHLRHYGYYTGRNDGYGQAVTTFEEWEKNDAPFVLSSDSSPTDSDNEDNDDKSDKDNKTQEELLRTTQLVYSYQAGKMVPKLREPRQLYGFNQNEMGPQQVPRWPAEVQVLNERIQHIHYVPPEPEPLRKTTCMEKMPMCRSHMGDGRIVYEYEPVVGNFFLRSRVGGCRTGCQPVAVTLEGPEDTTLIFESRFESGNLCRAVQIGEYDYELWLRNDLYTNKHTQWFYFRVSNTRPNVNYRFTIVNLMKPDSLYNHGMRPLVYSEKEAAEKKIGWIRGGDDIKYYRNNVKYHFGKMERNYYSLTWTCKFKHTQDTCYFAHCYPYTYSDLQDYLADILTDPVKTKLCKQRVLCRTLAGNLVYVLTITSPTKNSEEAKHRKAVVVTSRVHPGESNASWMMKGFLDYLLSNSADAKLLRDMFVFKIVPMLNPDGVIVGNYRSSLAGRDLNRNYKTVLKDSFPTIYHTRNMIRKLMEEREIILYCDLHGHSRRQNVFIYGCENRGNHQKRLRERVFPVMLSKNAPDKFSFDSCKFKIQKSKEGTGRIVMWNMGIMNSYTLEATFCGSSLGKMKGHHFNMADFESMGYHFCDTLLDYCDPDSTKCGNIIMELEERVKQEILQLLKQREGAEMQRDINEINLDDEYTSDIESSDGGSDSSASDGLPVHLQFMADKKKRLKTRRERDKHKCHGGGSAPIEQPAKKPPPLALTHKAPLSAKTRPKVKEDRSGGQPTYAQERAEERATKKTDGYLEALTNAYLKSGILVNNEDKAKDVPHFRYTGSNHRPASTNPALNLEAVMCPHHDKAFAAQYVANHLQQFNYPGLPEWQDVPLTQREPLLTGVKVSIAPRLDKHDLNDLSPFGRPPHHQHHPPGRQLRKPNSAKTDTASFHPLDFRPSQRHLVEISAAQQRQEEVLKQQQRKELLRTQSPVDPHGDLNSPIKQHPPPFDHSLERDKQRVESSPKPGSRSGSVSVTNITHYPSVVPYSNMDGAKGIGSVMLGPMEGPNKPLEGLTTPLDAPNRPLDAPNRPLDAPNRPLDVNHPDHHFPQNVTLELSHEKASSKSSKLKGQQIRSCSPLGKRKVHKRRLSNQPTFIPTQSPTHTASQPASYGQPAYVPTQSPTHTASQHTTPGQQGASKSAVPGSPAAFRATPHATETSYVPVNTAKPEHSNAKPKHQAPGSPPGEQKILETQGGATSQDSQNNSSNNGNDNYAESVTSSSRGSRKPVSHTHVELSDTINSIREIRQSLLDPARRTNISPTTGEFIDHFVRKTDEEISAIAAGLGQDFHPRSSSASAIAENGPPEGTDKHQQTSSPHYGPAQTSRSSPRGQHHSLVTLAPSVLTARSKSGVVRGTNESQQNSTNGTNSRRGSRSSTNQQMVGPRTATQYWTENRNAVQYSTLLEFNPNTLTQQQSMSRIDINDLVQKIDLSPTKHRGMSGSRWIQAPVTHDEQNGEGLTPGGEPETLPHTREGSANRTERHGSGKVRLNSSAGPRLITSPTKISLMISQGHKEHEEPGRTKSGQFHPSTRPSARPSARPHMLRTFPQPKRTH